MRSQSPSESRFTPFAYAGIAFGARLAAYLYFPRLRVLNAQGVPRGEGVLIVSNHIDFADPWLLLAVVPRRSIFLAMRKLFSWPVVGLLARLIGALPVRDDGPALEVTRTTLRALRGGGAVVVFPEGERSRTPGLLPASSGAALLAYRSGCAVVPVAIMGTERVSWPGTLLRPLLGPKITVRFGEPFRLPPVERLDTATLKEGTDVIMRRLAALLPAAYRGVYGEIGASGSCAEADVAPR
jgi:1-acyl-sn-glycerol-3-phosphate acyltransferase